MNTEDKITIECECGTHLLQVVSDIEETNPKIHSFYLAMFQYGTAGLTWRHRFRYAWHLLLGKPPYADQITLAPDEAKKMADFINSKLQSQEK